MRKMLYTTYTGYAMLSIHALQFFLFCPGIYEVGQQHFSNKDDDDDKNRDQIQSRTIRKL